MEPASNQDDEPVNRNRYYVFDTTLKLLSSFLFLMEGNWRETEICLYSIISDWLLNPISFTSYQDHLLSSSLYPASSIVPSLMTQIQSENYSAKTIRIQRGVGHEVDDVALLSQSTERHWKAFQASPIHPQCLRIILIRFNELPNKFCFVLIFALDA